MDREIASELYTKVGDVALVNADPWNDSKTQTQWRNEMIVSGEAQKTRHDSLDRLPLGK